MRRGHEPLCDPQVTCSTPPTPAHIPPPIFNKPAWDSALHTALQISQREAFSQPGLSKLVPGQVSDLGNNGHHSSLALLGLCTYLPIKTHVHIGVYRLRVSAGHVHITAYKIFTKSGYGTSCL